MPRTRPRTDAGTLAETRAWVRTAADERAVKAGMRFDPERADFVCRWVEDHCHFYEGDLAGEPFRLLPFQADYVRRLFGWVRWSDEWGGWVRRFTHAAFWAAKKNGKSPLCAAVNLYLLAGDGEAGNKVYQAAANGEQARIAQRHAVEMVKQSPALLADCKVNQSTLQVAHLPTASVLMILTGDDSRGAKAREGLNGSLAVDELHVFPREMAERTSRAGISRREPLFLSYSTAGDDPSSYGHERAVYGRQVAAGDRDDPHFLHVEYAPAGPVADAEIDDRLEELAAAANPAWGEIVKPTELRADWRRTKGNQREVARFKQYRLNLWVGSTNQWLDVAGWERGGEDFTLADLAGRACYAGLDLSRTRDLTSFVMAFPWPEDGPEAVRVWPMFWMPRQTAGERDHLFPFLSWGAAGAITLTDGGVVDYGRVKHDIRRAVTAHGVRVTKLFYDAHLAEELTQALHEGERLGGESAPGVVEERVAFPQTIVHFSGPAKEFERRVSAGQVRHPRNPVLTWQVGHCESKTDFNQNVRPVKPSPWSGKSVDGVVALCMAFADILPDPGGPSVYESRGLVILGGADGEPEQKAEGPDEPDAESARRWRYFLDD